MTGEAGTIPCGCMGKTSLDAVVHPAKRRVRQQLAERGVYLTGALECGLLPRCESIEREPIRITVDAPLDGGRQPTPTADVSMPAWGLAAVLSAPERGTSVGAFADALEVGYSSIADGERIVVAKGHSIQVSNADRTTVVFERLRPRGERRRGYVAGNVDVIHAFPELLPERQAAIASAHALNDCYAYGATEERVLRPLVGVPESADEPRRDEVERWYRAGISGDIALRRPTIIPHDGDGWLFGATVTAELPHAPPIHAGRLEPGDGVLLSRSLGAVAALSAAREAGDGAAIERAVETLATDHASVGEVIASLSPGSATEFDSDRHLKLATDVSGPGLGGVVDAIARSGCRLRVERLPFVDDEAIRRARRRWLVPDATVGTNGPIAVVGRKRAIARAESRLRDAGCAPVRLGRVESGNGAGIVSSADRVELSQFIESRTLHTVDYDRGDVAHDAGGIR